MVEDARNRIPISWFLKDTVKLFSAEQEYSIFAFNMGMSHVGVDLKNNLGYE